MQVSLWSPCSYSEVWQSAEEEHFALMGKVWAEGVQCLTLFPLSFQSLPFLHSLPFSLPHPFLSSSSFLIFCCPCYFFSFLPWVNFSWALHSGIIWALHSGPPCDWSRIQPRAFCWQHCPFLLPSLGRTRILNATIILFLWGRHFFYKELELPSENRILIAFPKALALDPPLGLRDFDLRYIEDKVVFRAVS